MIITSVDSDYDALTVTLIAEFDNPIGQVWELWSDPRKLGRWWGPPGYGWKQALGQTDRLLVS